MEKKWTRREFITMAGVATTGAVASLSWGGWSWAARALNRKLLEKRRYQGLRGLADLPYFEMTDRGLLRLTVDGLRGGIDGHTHFSLNALAGGEPDLLKSHPRTQYYLNPEVNASLDVYINQNNSKEDRRKMGGIVFRSIAPGGSSVTETHTIPNLLAEMDLLHIEKAVVFPIRYGLPFGDDMTEWYLEAIKKSGKQDRFIVCGSVKPTLKDAPKKVGEYRLKGLKGIKMHPNFSRFYPNDREAWPAYEACAKHNMPVLIHSGRTGFKEKKSWLFKLYTEDYADIHNFREPIAAFPQVRFVLCHAGALQNDQAIGIAREHKNVWMDIHGQGIDNIRTMIKELGPERLLYGTDWAFYPEAIMLARLLIATEGDRTVRRMIFSDNARRFWGITG
jgi:predicted TIM-barrel fold metal-dependent hydrolase